MCGENRQNAYVWLLRVCACALVVLALLAGLGVSAISVEHQGAGVHSHEDAPFHPAEVIALELLTGASLAIALRRIGPLPSQRLVPVSRVEWMEATWQRTAAWSPGGAMGMSGMVLRI